MDPSLPSLSTSSSSSSSSTTSWLSGIVRGHADRSGSLKLGSNSATAGASDTAGPVILKNQFRGFYSIMVLSLYRYLEPLAIDLENAKWSLVQFLMSSSYNGYGTSNLQQDAMELDQLISHFIHKEDSEGVVLLGHSTGCQDIVHYMRTNAAFSRAVRAAILQKKVLAVNQVPAQKIFEL
ncbi:UPF0613 protein PB24D3.06c-like [Quillaja saponaria]|uniref:UPF0613 protein PB24D3.06c-like n=1 Tax=Quillaja saponaria TaxID=32244 RepID=A0AAD7PHG1_QUISA|nr:UPF0613 protein PB24D3.06c-like [Quillaja saponaria]